MNNLVWEAPPEKKGPGRPSPWLHFVPELKTRPYEWARVHEYKSPSSAVQAARRVNKGLNPALEPHGLFEAQASGSTLYVRFLGVED